MHRNLTWLAVIVTMIATVPGEVAGTLAGSIYGTVLGHLIEGNVLDMLSNGWATTIVVKGGSAFLAGAISGLIAMWLCVRLFKAADYIVVAYSVSSVVIAFTIVAVLSDTAKENLGLSTFAAVINSIGLISALFMLAREHAPQASKVPPTASSG